MSSAVGPLAVIPADGRGPLFPGASEVSEHTQQLIDDEARRIVEEAHEQVVALLEETVTSSTRSPGRCSSTRRSTRMRPTPPPESNELRPPRPPGRRASTSGSDIRYGRRLICPSLRRLSRGGYAVARVFPCVTLAAPADGVRMLVCPSSHRTRTRRGSSWSTSSITPARLGCATFSDSTTILSPTLGLIYVSSSCFRLASALKRLARPSRKARAIAPGLVSRS
jgi:hypothetical protein